MPNLTPTATGNKSKPVKASWDQISHSTFPNTVIPCSKLDALEFMFCPVIRKVPSQTPQKLGEQYQTEVGLSVGTFPIQGKTKHKFTCSLLYIFHRPSVVMESPDPHENITCITDHKQKQVSVWVSVIIHEAQTFHLHTHNNQNNLSRLN